MSSTHEYEDSPTKHWRCVKCVYLSRIVGTVSAPASNADDGASTRPFKRPRVESMLSCAADMADEDDKENQDANTPPGTVRPPQSDAMDAVLGDEATAPLAQLRDGLLRAEQRGGSDGSDRASCASDINDIDRVRCSTCRCINRWC